MALYLNEPILPPPGIQRDRTPYSSDVCTDGIWTRFYEGAPMSMLGYKTLSLGNEVIVRSMENLPVSEGNQIYIGQYNSLQAMKLDYTGQNVGIADRTPESWTPTSDVLWSFAAFANEGTETDPLAPLDANLTYMVAAPTKDAVNFQREEDVGIYSGRPDSDTPFVPVLTGKIVDGDAVPATSTGGIVTIGSTLVSLRKAGYIAWTQPGQIQNWTDNRTSPAGGALNLANIAPTKIIKAYPTVGTESPTGIFWALNTIERATYIPSETGATGGNWIPQTIQTNSSLQSPNAVAPYGQEFYWVGTSQFYRYTGVVTPIPNTRNSQFFFDYLHKNSRSKVWAVANPRYGEVWFFFPKKDTKNSYDLPDQEVNHAVIFSVAENAWYDTPVSRSAGIPPSFFEYPIWADSSRVPLPYKAGNLTSYPIWQHEIGEDQIITVEGQPYTSPIKKSITFPRITAFQSSPENNRSLRPCRLETDLVQQGDMTVEVQGRKWARSTPIIVGPFTFTPDTQFVDDIYSQGRLINFKFTSNVKGGFYHFGRITLDYQLGSLVP